MRALLFDLDGTLCDSATLHYQAWSHAAEVLRVPVPSWEEYTVECLRGQSRFEDLLDLGKVDAGTRSSLYGIKSRRFRRLAFDLLRPLAGVEKLWARANGLSLHMAVVSTARRRSVEDTLEVLHLPDPDLVIAREDVAYPKPDPAGYRLAAKKLGCAPIDCLAFEDSPAGIQATVAAGIPCLAMRSSVFTSQEQSKALLLLESLEDVELLSLKGSCIELRARGTALNCTESRD